MIFREAGGPLTDRSARIHPIRKRIMPESQKNTGAGWRALYGNPWLLQPFPILRRVTGPWAAPTCVLRLEDAATQELK